MIKEFEQFHGVVFSRIIHKFGVLKIASNINSDNSSYLINDVCPLYIKYSKKRLTPWQFTFNSEHYETIKKLEALSENGYVALVCGFDGVCCISFLEFFLLINEIEVGTTKSITISRFKNQKYKVNGTDYRINHKYSDIEMDL